MRDWGEHLQHNKGLISLTPENQKTGNTQRVQTQRGENGNS